MMNRVHIQKNKIRGIFLSALLFCAFGCMLAGVLMLHTSNVARAEASPKELSPKEANASLTLPSSYEQYLKLNSPSSVALSDKYIAIADENTIYVYDKTNASEGYRTYQYDGGDHVTIGKLQFSTSERLYFSSTAGLYELSLENEFTATQVINFSPYTFLIDGETLFTVTKSESITPVIYAFDSFENRQGLLQLNNASRSIPIDQYEKDASPLITLAENILYCAIGDNVLRYSPSSLQLLNGKFYLNSDFTLSPVSICAADGALFYTTTDGLYRSDLSGNSELIVNGSSFGALTEWNGSLYFLQDKAVREYNIGTEKVTDYEIAASSSSVNRLNAATDCVRAGNLLVTADTGNNRISVYDLAVKSFETLSCVGVKSVTTDGTIIAAATGDKIFIYEKVFDPETRVRKFSCTETLEVSNVVGVACVYNCVYCVTNDCYYKKIVRGDNEDNNWVESSSKQCIGSIPKAIAADLFGDIFVADNSGAVYKFSEENFTMADDLGKTVANIGANFSSLRAGFDGTLYYLDESGQLCSAGSTEPQPLATVDGQNFVYTDDTDKSPTSFALGFEDDEVYFLFGDFIVKSNTGALGLETLESVSAAVLESSAEALASVHSPDGTNLIDFHEGAVGIHVDLGALEGDRPCCSGYARFAEARRGVLLAESGGYSLVALYREHTYSVELFRSEDGDAPFAPSFGGLSAEETMYLASECTPYNYPCILPSPARAEAAAPRGARVRVLDVVRAGGSEETLGGYDFAYIEYETAARAVLRGYVPLAYLTTVDPLGSETQSFFLGYVKPGAVFLADDGSSMHIEEKVQARLYENEDGTYTAVYTSADGVEYTANVTKDMIDRGESDALRIALIVILSVVACLIIGGYVYLLPKNKKK